MTAYKNPGLLLAFASPVAFSVGNIGVRVISGEVTVWGLILLRGCLGVMLVWLMARQMKKPLWGRHWKLLSIIGGCGFFSTACTFTAISQIPLYQALVLLYLYPTISIVLAALINGERVHPRDIIPLFLTLLGCLMLIWPDQAAGLDFKNGHLVGLLGSFFYALGFVLARRLGNDNSGLEPIFHYSLYCAVGAVVAILVFGRVTGLDNASEMAGGLGVGMVASLGQLLGYAAVRWLPAHKVGVIGTLEVFAGAVSSWLIFNDPMTVRALAGGGLILFASFYKQS
jgi:drug/metabolite transporter (DMT)-like permease